MNTLVVIQARLASTRLPGKINMLISGKSMLTHVYERACRIGPTHIADARHYPEIPEQYVLARFAAVAERYPLVDTFVRLTADCPMLDVGLARDMLREFETRNNDAGLEPCDIMSTSPRLDGLDVQIFTREALREAVIHAKSSHDREHVTTWMLMVGRLHTVFVDFPGTALHWSVDTQEDLDFVREVFVLCDLCRRGVPHHTNAVGSTAGSDGRHPIWDIHQVEDGGLCECRAYDLLMSRTGGDAYISK